MTARPRDGVVIVDDGDGPRIETPELRLVFRRPADRWTHALLVGPCERPADGWAVFTEPIEWYEALEDPAHVVGPVYQDLQVSADGAGARVLAVGQAGPHHFSAAVSVTRSWSGPNKADRVHATTRVEFDVADRCRGVVKALEANYRVHYPPALYLIGHDARPWCERLVWETSAERDYDASVQGMTGSEGASRIALESPRPDGRPERIRVAAAELNPGGTNRLRYAWTRTRVMPRSEADGFPGS